MGVSVGKGNANNSRVFFLLLWQQYPLVHQLYGHVTLETDYSPDRISQTENMSPVE